MKTKQNGFLSWIAQEIVNPTHQTEAAPKSPACDPSSRSGSDESDGNEETKDQDMVDLTENEGASNNEELPEPYNQEKNEEHFIETLIERNQNGRMAPNP